MTNADEFLVTVPEKHRNAYMNEFHNFRKTFDVNLKTYWLGGYLGFDLTKFDDDVIQSLNIEDKSMEDIIRENYGDDGVRIIRALILYEEEQ